MLSHSLKLFIFSLLISGLTNAKDTTTPSEFVVHYRTESVEADGMHQYYMELIETALKYTEKDYGSYQLIALFDLTFTRTKQLAKNNTIPNLLMGTSYSKEIAAEFAYVPIPMDFGITSYRVCFTSVKRLKALKKVQNLNDLRQFSIGQGKDWLDVGVLRANGLNVIEYPNYKSLFRAVARNRFDLFCRSITEILPEWNTHSDIEGLTIEPNLLLYYNFPRFFWTNKENSLLIERLTKGLIEMHKDGSALAIWKKYNKINIEFTKLKQRHIINLENPQLEGLPTDYKNYLYNPLESNNHY